MRLNKILFIFLFLSINQSFSQDLDLKKVDKKFIEKNKINNDTYINIYLNSNDCYRCFGEIHQILKAVEKEKDDTQINILTNQIVFAKKNTKDYSVNKKFYIDHDIFQKAPQSFYYYKYNGQIISDITEIISKIDKSNNAISNNITSIQTKDSLFTSDNLISIGKLDNLLLVYDQSVDLGGIINIENADIDYFESTTVSEKLFNLPYKLPLKEPIILNYNDFQEFKKLFPGTREIKVTSISIKGEFALAQFIVSRAFEIPKEEKYGLFSFNYIATKKIDKNNLSHVFDLDSYDNYFGMDFLPYDNRDLRVGVSIYYPFKLLNKHHFTAKIFHELDYIGEAGFEFSDDYSQLNITSIDTNASEIYDYIFLEINGKEYYIDKEMTNESTGEGIITLKERVIHQ